MSEVAQPTAQPGTESAAGNGAQPGGASGTPVAPAAAPAAGSEDWKARFDGLMSMHQQTLAAKEAELAALRAAQTAPAPKVEAPATQPQTPGFVTREEFEAMQAELLQSKVDAARADAVKAFPQLEKFADMLNADTPQELMLLASELAARLDPAAPAPVTETATEEPTEPTAPVMPSSTTYVPVTDDAIEALKADVRNNVPGAFGRLMNLKAQQASQQ